MDNLSANVIKTSPPSPRKNPLQTLLTPKIIFIILGVVILVEIMVAARSLFDFNITPSPAKTNISQAVTGGKISLTASKNTFGKNEGMPVVVNIDSGGRFITGVDLIVKFDPKLLDITDNGIKLGTLLDDYPLASVNLEKGQVLISGISNEKNGIKLSGQFVSLTFKTKEIGKTSLAIDFEKGTTTHSNLVESGTIANVLEQVDNLEVEIK